MRPAIVSRGLARSRPVDDAIAVHDKREREVTTEWQTEEAIEGLKRLRVRAGTDDVLVSWGQTPEKASTYRGSVMAGTMRIFEASGAYIGWRGSGGRVIIEQSTK